MLNFVPLILHGYSQSAALFSQNCFPGLPQASGGSTPQPMTGKFKPFSDIQGLTSTGEKRFTSHPEFPAIAAGIFY